MTEEHIDKKTITEEVEYPKHKDRRETDEYRDNRRWLIDKKDKPCLVCGAKENREVHHWFEWSEWNNIDQEEALNVFRGDHWYQFSPYGYASLFGDKPVRNPDDLRNLGVFCQKHHRETEVGFHETTGPVWFANDSAKEQDGVLNKMYEDG